jgi:hypothetical protein
MMDKFGVWFISICMSMALVVVLYVVSQSVT